MTIFLVIVTVIVIFIIYSVRKGNKILKNRHVDNNGRVWVFVDQDIEGSKFYIEPASVTVFMKTDTEFHVSAICKRTLTNQDREELKEKGKQGMKVNNNIYLDVAAVSYQLNEFVFSKIAANDFFTISSMEYCDVNDDVVLEKDIEEHGLIAIDPHSIMQEVFNMACHFALNPDTKALASAYPD